ncbi:unnamed protein product [Allacma fusca]|uniref:ACB domain-containing protein n=1 Tax=Allacma fusca TaxID=39272 RepID=A0A8J2JE09_9HEXA|nr:unnamed protein product [Allacma fusca]
MGVKEEFDKAVEFIQNLPKEGPYQPSDNAKLEFYGWYKQATEGKCTAEKPSFYNLVAKAKWNAWNDLGDMAKEEAMVQYIVKFKEIQQKYQAASS